MVWALKGSLDALVDPRAAHVLSALTHAQQSIRGPVSMAETSNAILAAQKLIEERELKGRVFTASCRAQSKKTFEVARIKRPISN